VHFQTKFSQFYFFWLATAIGDGFLCRKLLLTRPI